MRDFIVWFRFVTLRAYERLVPVRVFYWNMKLYAFLHAAFKKNRSPVPLPALFGDGKELTFTRQRRMNVYLNGKLEMLPDRLATPKWAKRWRIVGLEHLQEARKKGPVVLATCHFGPYFMMRTMVRAAGIPASALVSGKVQFRSRLNRLIDKVVLFPEINPSFHMDQLREVSRFIAGGNTFFLVLDQKSGKEIEVPVGNGWIFRMAAGAIRLAARHDAELLPCCLIEEGPWRFRMEIGRPVPRELLKSEADWARAGQHMLEQLMPHFLQHPQQCAPQLIGRFRRADAAPQSAAALRQSAERDRAAVLP